MSVVALVCEASHSQPVITCAARFALALKTELVIYYLTDVNHFQQPKIWKDGEEEFTDPTREAIQTAIETVVRTRHARKGRIGRYEVSVRYITDNDPVNKAITRIRREAPQLFVGICESDFESDKLAISRQVASRVVCDSIVLYGEHAKLDGIDDIVVGVNGGRNDQRALTLATTAMAITKGSVTAVGLGHVDKSESNSARKSVAEIVESLSIRDTESLQSGLIKTAELDDLLACRPGTYDLMLVVADSGKLVSHLLGAEQNRLVGVFRRAPQLAVEQGWIHALSRLPRINPADYADLYERLQFGSRWNTDFVMMLSLATAIASLGLLQNSIAVVIGSMLLAPLMTPMIGMGLALNRGNAKLAYASFRAIGRGFLASFFISAFIGWVTPGSDLTPEIIARTDPNILDLFIALFSGSAAAYAMARPGLAGSIAGVAIATALVPPLCSSGISFAYGQFNESIAAAWLLLANILAIILAAALTFRAMGLNDRDAIAPRREWVWRVVVGLLGCSLIVSFPLFSNFIDKVHTGEKAPIALMVTSDTKNAIMKKIDSDPGVELLLIGRPGIPRESDTVDVGVVISSVRPLPRSYADELTEIIREKMQDPSLRVRVECVANAWQ